MASTETTRSQTDAKRQPGLDTLKSLIARTNEAARINGVTLKLDEAGVLYAEMRF
jgi:hypothetical protein